MFSLVSCARENHKAQIVRLGCRRSDLGNSNYSYGTTELLYWRFVNLATTNQIRTSPPWHKPSVWVRGFLYRWMDNPLDWTIHRGLPTLLVRISSIYLPLEGTCGNFLRNGNQLVIWSFYRMGSKWALLLTDVPCQILDWYPRHLYHLFFLVIKGVF